jgi:DnaJ-class molecular chaperone
MGLFSYLSDWKTNLYEKRMAQAENLGHCPDCNGRGFQIPIVNEYSYSESYECLGCNGKGTFSEWSMNNQKS